MCDPLQTSAKEKHCLENGPADWFIVLDVSWFNESNKLQNLATTKSTFEKQTLLTDQLITFLSKTERARPRKNRMSILLATGQMVHIVRRLCDEKPLENSRPKLRALPNVRPSNNQILLDEVFDDIDKQSSICNEQFSSTKQRIVLCKFILSSVDDQTQ
uniref:Uncharacterized protein n=1 Tax=Romanomermis culicivorax TaxID=13658 RepID=A0A915L314_ROMCU